MTIYNKVPDKFISIAAASLQKAEAFKISKPVLYENKKYFEIVFNKKLFGILRKNVVGRLIIDEQGSVIKDNILLNNLARLFYYYAFFFDAGLSDLKNTIKTDTQLKREERDYKEAASVLQRLADEGVGDAGRVKSIVDRYPNMRVEADKVLKMVIQRVEEYLSNDTLFSEEVLDDVLSLYIKTLVLNFERIKFINGASGHYDTVKREIIKRKRKIKNRIGRKFRDSVIKPENILTFFINILKYYDEVINYSSERYKKYLLSKDAEYIKKYSETLRNKKN